MLLDKYKMTEYLLFRWRDRLTIDIREIGPVVYTLLEVWATQITGDYFILWSGVGYVYTQQDAMTWE